MNAASLFLGREVITTMNLPLDPAVQQWFEATKKLVDESLERDRRKHPEWADPNSPENVAARRKIRLSMRRFHRRKRREDLIVPPLYELASQSIVKQTPVGETMQQLIGWLRSQYRHGIWKEAATIQYASAVTELLQWEPKLLVDPDWSSWPELARVSFDLCECGDRGYALNFRAYESDEQCMYFADQRLDLTAFRQINQVMEADEESTPERSLAADIFIRDLELIFACSLTANFCTQSQVLVPACNEPKAVRVVAGGCMVCRIGTAKNGRFEPGLTPLVNVYPNLE